MSVGIGKGVDRYDAVAKQLSNPAVKMNQLIQYAQGTNPLVPSFMALAEIQNRQNAVALQPGQFSPTTVQQDLITKAEAPRMPMGMPSMAPQQAPQGVAALQAPQGVAALPSGMGQQSFAGGGIVAFSGDKPESSDVKDPDADTSDNAYLNRSRGLVEGVKNMVGPIFNPRSYDLPYLYQRDIGQPFEKYANKVVEGFKETPEEQAARFRSYSMTPNQTPTVGFARPSNVPMTSEQVKKMMPAEEIKGNEAKLFEAEALAKKISPQGKALPTIDSEGKRLEPTKAQAPTKAFEGEVTPKAKLFADYEEMLKQQGEESKKDRETNKYMRLLEAGLGIMGGTSPYALTNIGQGATQAVRGYAQDVAGMRKEQRENIKDLAALGMKREEFAQEARKLDITQQHYNDLKDLGYKELDIKRMIVNKTPEQIQLVMRYASDPAFAKAFQDMSADKKTSAIDQLIMQSMQGGGAQPIDRDALARDLEKYKIKI